MEENPNFEQKACKGRNVSSLRIHFFLPSTSVLGPYQRSALWLQGCERDCPGCMSQEARVINGGKLMSINTIIDQIVAAGHKEITISGGEPFLQAEGLAQLVQELRQLDFGIIIYTGYTIEELRGLASISVDTILANIDILIDGQYIDRLNDGQGLVGSNNQRVFLLTDRYKEVSESTYTSNVRRIELTFHSDRIFIAGVPDQETLKKIKEELGCSD